MVGMGGDLGNDTQVWPVCSLGIGHWACQAILLRGNAHKRAGKSRCLPNSARGGLCSAEGVGIAPERADGVLRGICRGQQRLPTLAPKAYEKPMKDIRSHGAKGDVG